MLLLGRKTALEKVAAFVLEMDERTGASGCFGFADGPPRYRRLFSDCRLRRCHGSFQIFKTKGAGQVHQTKQQTIYNPTSR